MRPALAAIQQRSKQNAAESRERERDELALKLFPDWPDDRRAAPNPVIRAAVFGIVRHGRRQEVKNLPIAAPEGLHLTLTGWQLDQSDCDVWLEVMHLARGKKPDELIRFTINAMLKQLGFKGDGADNRLWLKQRLERLSHTILSFESAHSEGVSGPLLVGFRLDKVNGKAVVRTNPELRSLFESITHLDIERRRSLGHNQLAKALHAMLSSHADWLPMKVETIMQRVGAHRAQLKYFRRDLRAVLTDFERREWIDGWHIDKRDLVHIALRPSPTQIRLLERRQG